MFRRDSLLLAAAVARPWRWSEATWQAVAAWTPSPRAVIAGSPLLGALLFWFVVTRFQSTSINAVEFTVYFDRPCFQKIQGRRRVMCRGRARRSRAQRSRD